MIPYVFIATVITNEDLLQKAATFMSSGIVYQKGTYAYLKITDNYIHDLYDLLKDTPPNLAKPDYFSINKSAGAHITITYAEENVVLSQEDLEQSHSFAIESLSHVLFGNKGYFVLSVSSPSLEKLREKYGLSKQPYYKDNSIIFHITIASYSLWGAPSKLMLTQNSEPHTQK